MIIMLTKANFSFRNVAFLVAVFLLTLSFGSTARAQDLLTNSSVVEMVKSGLSSEIIIAKIQASSVSFDTSAEALKALSESGVPEKIVIAMINEESKSAKEIKRESKERDNIMGGVPEQGNLHDLLSKSLIFILTDDLKSRDIIVKQLGKVKKFKIVDKLEGSDFVIKYESWVEVVNVTATVTGNTATARENKQTIGLFTILMPSDDPGLARVRQVYSARKSKYWVWEDNPAESTTKQFIKDLTKAAALNSK